MQVAPVKLLFVFEWLEKFHAACDKLARICFSQAEQAAMKDFRESSTPKARTVGFMKPLIWQRVVFA